MRTVLYTHDLMPITVFDLPQMAMDYIRRNGVVEIAVLPAFSMLSGDADEKPDIRKVRIEGEIIRRDEYSAWMLFTHDEESALLIQAAFLPGQVGAVKRKEREAFARGFTEAIIRLTGD